MEEKWQLLAEGIKQEHSAQQEKVKLGATPSKQRVLPLAALFVRAHGMSARIRALES